MSNIQALIQRCADACASTHAPHEAYPGTLIFECHSALESQAKQIEELERECAEWAEQCGRRVKQIEELTKETCAMEVHLLELAKDEGRLNALQEYVSWELAYSWDPEEPLPWQIHSVTGGRNDREWNLVGSGSSVRAAIDDALED